MVQSIYYARSSQAGSLKIHMQTVHGGNKDYKCESCSKSFSLAHNLKKHIHTVHERHKDYKCESCGKSFSRAQNLKKHIHTVHERHKDYKCNLNFFCESELELDQIHISEEIKIEIKEEGIIQNEKPENSPSDVNILFENELDLDQIPIYGMTPPLV